MATYLPLFPLQLVVFPGERLNLHVFEERYKQLISECFNGTKAFGIPSYFNETVQDFGTEAEVTAIEKIYPDGRMDVRIKGLRTFRILEFKEKAESAMYPAGTVSFEHEYMQYPINDMAQERISNKLKEILTELSRVLDVSKNLIPSRPQNMSFSIAHYLGMPLEKEYELLLTTNENERQQKLIQYLETALPDIKKRELMKTRIALNGHFKDIKPPDF
jgi:Lon protease-like protein